MITEYNNKPNPKLGDAEIAVINHLADAYNVFVQLQEFHPSDQREFEQAIHVCQHIVMSRVAVRSNPELFHVKPPKKDGLPPQEYVCYKRCGNTEPSPDGTICLNCGSSIVAQSR